MKLKEQGCLNSNASDLCWGDDLSNLCRGTNKTNRYLIALAHKQHYLKTWGTSSLQILLKRSDNDVRKTTKHVTFWSITRKLFD